MSVEVAAENEASAKAHAKEVALQKVPNSRAGDVQLEFIGESDMHVGMRIVHSIFGPGVVEEMEKTGGVKGSISFMVSVKFDRETRNGFITRTRH